MKFGKYEIIKEIGKGAMGVVYLAFDPIIERQVAIKTMNPQLFQDLEQRERFFREAKSAGILQHPNIVTIYDMGMEGDTPYIVMEYVEGEDLDSLIKAKKIDIESAVKIMVQLCDALAYAHSRGIIHRDIKPSNIRVLPDKTIKIMDFGIAKKSGSDLTQTGVLLGTVSYMAPEQLKEGKVSPQSDMFSAGIVFYEMLSGDRCFQGDTITAVMYKIVSFNEHQINLKTVPKSIENILKKMVSHLPENRYKSCAEISDLLKEILIEPTVKVGDGTKTTVLPPPIPQTREETEPTRVKLPEAEKKKSYTGIIVFFAVILLILIGVVFTVHKKQQRRIAMLRKQVRESESSKVVASDKGQEANSKLNKGVISSNNNQGSGQEMNERLGNNPEIKEQTQTEQLEKQVKPEKITAHRQVPVIKPPKKKRKPLREKAKEKEVFSYSQGVKRKERHLNFTKAQKDALKRFIKEAEAMPYPEKISMSNRLFNAGMQALGNGANRFAATSFFKSIILNPKRKESYAFLCIALAKMRAYDDIKKVIKKAEENGISLYDLRQNKMFDRMYNNLEQKGLLE